MTTIYYRLYIRDRSIVIYVNSIICNIIIKIEIAKTIFIFFLEILKFWFQR